VITTYKFTGAVVSQDEIRRVVDPAAVVENKGDAILASVTIDDAFEETLNDLLLSRGMSKTIQQQVVVPGSMDGWTTTGTPAGATDAPMARWGLASGMALVTRAGLLTRVSILSSLPASGSDLIATVFVDGIDSGLAAKLLVGSARVIGVSGKAPIKVGSVVDIRITTGLAWTALLANLSGVIDCAL